MNNSARRQFLKSLGFSAAVAGVFALLPGFLRETFAISKPAAAKEVPPPAGLAPVPATDAVAQAVGYVHDVKDIDYTRYPARKKPDAKNQRCNNCSLYTVANESWGKCSMVTNGAVHASGWCGSWSKKA